MYINQMNDVFWTDLPPLTEISNEIEKNAVCDNEIYDDSDIADFKESIIYFLGDFIDSNIKLYKEYKFENILYDSLYEIITNNYGSIIDELDIDLEYIIFDSMEIYFYKNNSFRSYAGTTIVKKPDKKRIKKLLEEYSNVEQPEQ